MIEDFKNLTNQFSVRATKTTSQVFKWRRQGLLPMICVMKNRRSKLSKRSNTCGPQSIFLIIPFVPIYADLEIAIWIISLLHAIEPKVARPVRSGHSQGISIKRMIHSCDFALAETSFEGRWNTILELGMAWEHFRDPGFRVVVLSDEPYRLDEKMSDLKGCCHVIAHRFDPHLLLTGLSEWFESDRRREGKIDLEAAVDAYEVLWTDYRKHYGYGNISRFFYEWRPLIVKLYREKLKVIRKKRSQKWKQYE